MNEIQHTPELRFDGFTEPWGQQKLSSLVSMHARIGWQNLRASEFLESGEFLLITGTDFVDGTVNYNCCHYVDKSRYDQDPNIQVKNGNILLTKDGTLGKVAFVQGLSKPATLNAGVFNIVVKDLAVIDSRYLFHYLRGSFLMDYVDKNATGGTIKHLNQNILVDFPVLLPPIHEQRMLGITLSKIDSLITLQQRKYERLQHLKQALLRKMFPKPGEQVPELRFEGFTEPWEQRKFKDIVTIERGGSPRPIEDFVTDSPNGLNWVKIGDAPSLGRYITRTAEKIRPEGLSKTRQVYPGDLILSNSMSFGRPYIMAIEGCIHDGWLLIRDTTKQLDPIYLCQMLGTPQMFNQYRSLAAGSTVNNLNKELVGNAVVPIPCKEEQKVIGKVLDDLDNLVILHQHKYERLQHLKQALLRKMFI